MAWRGEGSRSTAARRQCHVVVLMLDCSKEQSQEGVEMEPEVWAALPADVVERVLVHLPPLSVCRFRKVCKKWNILLSARKFLEQNAMISSRLPWFLRLAVDIGSGTVPGGHDPCLSKWHKVSLDFLPTWNIHSVASAGGLLCCAIASNLEYARSVVIVNPLTRSWRTLPDPPNRRFQKVAMVHNLGSKTYKVILSDYYEGDGDDDGYGQEDEFETFLHFMVSIFDSGSRSWNTSVHILPVYRGFEIEGNATFCDGRLYWLTVDRLPLCHSVLSYNVYQDVWTKVQLPPCPLADRTCMFPWVRNRFEGLHCMASLSCNLVEQQGRLLLVGEVVSEDGTHEVNIRIWEYLQKPMQWHEIGRVPAETYIRLLDRSPLQGIFTFVARDDVMWLSVHGCSASLAYDFSQKCFRRLPDCPYYVEQSSRWEALCCSVVLPFEPRLDSIEDSFIHSLNVVNNL